MASCFTYCHFKKAENEKRMKFQIEKMLSTFSYYILIFKKLYLYRKSTLFIQFCIWKKKLSHNLKKYNKCFIFIICLVSVEKKNPGDITIHLKLKTLTTSQHWNKQVKIKFLDKTTWCIISDTMYYNENNLLINKKINEERKVRI